MNTEQATSPLKAIKLKCRNDCCVGDRDMWKNCVVTDCQLYPFRMGTNPFRKKREMTEEQKEKSSERLRKAREQKTQ
jgi:hypothetical protein